MRHSLPHAVFIFLVWGLSSALPAQDLLSGTIDITASTPKGPLLQQPENVGYTMTFSYLNGTSSSGRSEDSNAGPNQIKAIAVDKVGVLRHDIRQWSGTNASATDVWYAETAAFKEGTDALGTPNGIHSEPAFSKGAEAFPELNWIAKNNFIGTIQQGGKVIDVYQKKFSGDEAGGFNPVIFQNEEVAAYIDDATKLPLGIKGAHFAVLYSYRKVPAVLDIPAKYQVAIDRYKAKKAHPYRVP